VALTDLHNLHGNSGLGLHIASLAGGWTVAVAGFGGLRDHNGELTFAPRLPPAISRLRFRIVYRGRKLTVTVTPEQATYSVDGDPLDIRHHGRQVTVGPGDLALALPPAPSVDPVRQPYGCAPRRRTRE
jgi:alpha,alpha-trehalose phosphorylase